MHMLIIQIENSDIYSQEISFLFFFFFKDFIFK